MQILDKLFAFFKSKKISISNSNKDDLGQNFYLEPNNYFVANFVGNPVIDNFNVKDGKITGSDFEINVDDLDIP